MRVSVHVQSGFQCGKDVLKVTSNGIILIGLDLWSVRSRACYLVARSIFLTVPVDGLRLLVADAQPLLREVRGRHVRVLSARLRYDRISFCGCRL